ncbi:CPBP family intramembrane metalloprotease [Leucobacter allii]|uniref:CPBP family intramembrane glutamic endopeptidase n=1 Tax=Leucobacter allii TaxID=2932247 RepID=UPI001FD1DCDA|nr:CPBP family intramembrane glutamic endopeptidase [Leucobacter allii]UOR01735.1 CPBP family intramembrane metalloprotease [Leucobacter allii]
MADELPPRSLPAPFDGMLRARRPTGIVMALVVVVLSGIVLSLPAIAQAIAFAADAIATGVRPDRAALVAAFGGPGGTLLGLFSFALAALLILLWVRVKERRPISSLGFAGGARRATGQALRGAALALAMMLVCVIVPVVSGDAALTWTAPRLGIAGIGFVLLMLLGFLLQGSTEELVTRGFLSQAVARRWGLIAAAAVQTVVFAALHGANTGMGVLPFVNLLLFALFAFGVALSDGALWGICAFHGVWNWAQGNLFGVAVSGNAAGDSVFGFIPADGSAALLTGGAFGIEGSIVTTLVYLAGIGLVLARLRRSRRGALPLPLPA